METRAVPDLIQELRELGASGAAYRVRRELRMLAGIEALLDRGEPDAEAALGSHRFFDDALMGGWVTRLPFTSPRDMATLRERIPPRELAALGERALQATRGRIRCFGRWVGDFGQPIDWFRNPTNGLRWDPGQHWSQALNDQARIGDVKLTWEVARFPHAYEFARTAAFGAASPEILGEALDRQIRSFVSNNPYGRGIHWNSGQEIVFRLMAFLFSVGTFARLGTNTAPGTPVSRLALPAFVARATFVMAQHLEDQLEFAQRAVYNNHLLSEALGLLLADLVLPPCAPTARWRRTGLDVLEEQADRQVYRDGAYIQQSHNYHRVAMQDYLWALRVQQATGQPVPPSWLGAMERSLDFLVAHQNPDDGRLPNYGFNDGALPCVLSTCDFSDFRPLLQAISVGTRGERIYEPGPWDETAAWFFGGAAVEEAKLRPPTRRSVAFRPTGYHVQRGRDPRSFSTFRCGTIRDRFSQIDMLHLDVWWRGQNVLIDPGSYTYNGPEVWHRHFLRTESHNTVQVDGHDQMLHFRQFKCLYWTRARLVAFEERDGSVLCVGEHEGFRRHPGNCVHRRSVLYVKDDLWIVVDRISGAGTHDVRLHWLGGDFAHEHDTARGRMTLHTSAGPFSVTVLDECGAPLAGSVVAGQESPPRGWHSRYYGERVPVPSFATERRAPLPVVTVSVLAAGTPEVTTRGGRWSVSAAGSAGEFAIEDGTIVLERAG